MYGAETCNLTLNKMCILKLTFSKGIILEDYNIILRLLELRIIGGARTTMKLQNFLSIWISRDEVVGSCN